MTGYFMTQQIPDASVWSFWRSLLFWLVFSLYHFGHRLVFFGPVSLEAVGATEVGNFFFIFCSARSDSKMNLFRLGGQWEFILVCVRSGY